MLPNNLNCGNAGKPVIDCILCMSGRIFWSESDTAAPKLSFTAMKIFTTSSPLTISFFFPLPSSLYVLTSFTPHLAYVDKSIVICPSKSNQKSNLNL